MEQLNILNLVLLRLIWDLPQNAEIFYSLGILIP